MSIWSRYSEEQRNEYIQFLQVYGALSNLFRQKQGELIPYLDSKFQETVFAKIFKSQNVDIGNTPHDVLSIFGSDRIGIGLKTWMSSKPSFQKVMQLKRYQNEINSISKSDFEAIAYKISEIKNEKMRSDYKRLGLTEDKNIYHYVTRDEGSFNLNESSYLLIDTNNLRDFNSTSTSLSWSDGNKNYKFTFGDSQIWQKFDSSKQDTFKLKQFDVNIIQDPFKFLLDSYLNLIGTTKLVENDLVEIYLPLYSFDSKEVEEKSGLNAWNGASKNKGSNTLRPLNEVYIPVPIDFHRKYPTFFTKDILTLIKDRANYDGSKENRPTVRFHLQLPNGKRIPSLLTGDNLKNFQSGSNTEYDENGKRFGQSALGQWLLLDVLGLKERKLVTREWLQKKGTDSVRLWRKKDDYSIINIDFAPVGSFESFMKDEPIPQDEEL
ncbi:phospholipase D-like domain-containing protein [Flavobacterium psychrophilum]|uniref:restriction endonuclease PLD domain-containing protein n=1 Tax=Flavobacterium psychrophilum TaxID=96345 RepID=UPI00061873DC|nr:restriction endonuclease PLD domain-containing protein [Flavobacterium psychrophilum]EKT3965112.1 NgoFVII family restriction endonuclease [Flavobacterium psychrophilum]MCB5981632.1 NgoFVII family restriction endonuclease [Flavobacterium psychrophilum]MCB6010655.1 NgoFVII family restriction endonuclease [Flavobacterium psychrophilum]MCB6015710.1 NgoFVII family restriction endonuclease [Flavobacterium psychrophilum]MCB6023140.1 NgoFVII family restriction endonuclease [Flavobacterium psychroph